MQTKNGPVRFDRPFHLTTTTDESKAYGVVDDDEKVKHSFTVNVLFVTVAVPASPSSSVRLPLTLLTFWIPLQVTLQSAFVVQVVAFGRPAEQNPPVHVPAVVTICPKVWQNVPSNLQV
jgi:hypothetical protein